MKERATPVIQALEKNTVSERTLFRLEKPLRTCANFEQVSGME